jgi:hypothetical protein
MQDNAVEHTEKYSVDAVDEVFGDQVINRGLLPVPSSDLNSCLETCFHNVRHA